MVSFKLVLIGLACFVVGAGLSHFVPAQVEAAGSCFAAGVFFVGWAVRRPGDAAPPAAPGITPPARVDTLPEVPEAKRGDR